ncbi:MAG: zinc-ribbon domain-containing protein [Desulfobacterales bacterium]|nr:zinc-ribbon domain-containing protein [Desulfobacterales bacterium]
MDKEVQKICPHCGKLNPADVTRCIHCGRTLGRRVGWNEAR